LISGRGFESNNYLPILTTPNILSKNKIRIMKISANLDNITKVTSYIEEKLPAYNLILLKGGLGAGKTSLVKALHKTLGLRENEIVSPTFTLLNIYDSKKLNGQVWHYDLYRLKSEQDIHNLDLEEALDNHLTIIEWPEIIEHILPKKRMEINIFSVTENKREYEILY
jgi:tRNA threonylcarbamoyladenosine biosynthesis protein TsaE